MAKKRRPRKPRREDRSAGASPPGPGGAVPGEGPCENLLDAVAEIVHQGYGRLLDAGELRASLGGWQPNCSMNYEYVFAWKPSFDPSAIDIDWGRPRLRILRRVVKDPDRVKIIKGGSPMTKAERQAYRLEFARQKHGYRSAEECLDSGTDCQWADLSVLTDSRGREVYVLEMADAVVDEAEGIDAVVGQLEEIWRWKMQPLTTVGPFASPEEAEQWMAENGAFKEAD